MRNNIPEGKVLLSVSILHKEAGRLVLLVAEKSITDVYALNILKAS